MYGFRAKAALFLSALYRNWPIAFGFSFHMIPVSRSAPSDSFQFIISNRVKLDEKSINMICFWWETKILKCKEILMRDISKYQYKNNPTWIWFELCSVGSLHFLDIFQIHYGPQELEKTEADSIWFWLMWLIFTYIVLLFVKIVAFGTFFQKNWSKMMRNFSKLMVYERCCRGHNKISILAIFSVPFPKQISKFKLDHHVYWDKSK